MLTLEKLSQWARSARENTRQNTILILAWQRNVRIWWISRPRPFQRLAELSYIYTAGSGSQGLLEPKNPTLRASIFAAQPHMPAGCRQPLQTTNLCGVKRSGR